MKCEWRWGNNQFSTESRRVRVRVINLNPKMAEEEELHQTLRLLRKRKPAEAAGDGSVAGSVQTARIRIGQWLGRSSGKQAAWYTEGGREAEFLLNEEKEGEAPEEGQPLHSGRAAGHGPAEERVPQKVSGRASRLVTPGSAKPQAGVAGVSVLLEMERVERRPLNQQGESDVQRTGIPPLMCAGPLHRSGCSLPNSPSHTQHGRI